MAPDQLDPCQTRRILTVSSAMLTSWLALADLRFCAVHERFIAVILANWVVSPAAQSDIACGMH